MPQRATARLHGGSGSPTALALLVALHLTLNASTWPSNVGAAALWYVKTTCNGNSWWPCRASKPPPPPHCAAAAQAAGQGQCCYLIAGCCKVLDQKLAQIARATRHEHNWCHECWRHNGEDKQAKDDEAWDDDHYGSGAAAAAGRRVMGEVLSDGVALAHHLELGNAHHETTLLSRQRADGRQVHHPFPDQNFPVPTISMIGARDINPPAIRGSNAPALLFEGGSCGGSCCRFR